MATLRCLASGSQGNAYILECKNETLLIELGLNWTAIKKGLNYDLSKVVAVLASHKHFDHLYRPSLLSALKSGLSVFSNKEVGSIYKGVKVLPLGVKTQIEGFKIQPLLVPHNTECYAYIITHKEFGKLLFCTDCSAFKYKVKDCNHILIEANYSDDIIIDNMCNNEFSRSASENHLEIGQTIDVLKHNYSPELQSVVLLHLSNGNSNAKEFIQRVKNELCFENVFVADKGLEIELNKSEF